MEFAKRYIEARGGISELSLEEKKALVEADDSVAAIDAKIAAKREDIRKTVARLQGRAGGRSPKDRSEVQVLGAELDRLLKHKRLAKKRSRG